MREMAAVRVCRHLGRASPRFTLHAGPEPGRDSLLPPGVEVGHAPPRVPPSSQALVYEIDMCSFHLPNSTSEVGTINILIFHRTG